MIHFASHDWNCNGRIDSGDDFMEYMIFQDVMGSGNGELGYDDDDSDSDDEDDD